MNRMKLISLRKKANLTQKELARRLNVSTATVSAWENGKVKITEKNKDKLLNFFRDEDVTDLFNANKPNKSNAKNDLDLSGASNVALPKRRRRRNLNKYPAKFENDFSNNNENQDIAQNNLLDNDLYGNDNANEVNDDLPDEDLDIYSELSQEEAGMLQKTALAVEDAGANAATIKVFIDMLSSIFKMYNHNCLNEAEFNLLKQLIFSQILGNADLRDAN